MPTKTILLSDDVFAEKKDGKARSKALQSLAKDVSARLKTPLRIITALDFPKKVISSKLSIEETATEAIYGYPVEVILKESSKQGVELLIMGTRGRSGLKRTFLGSVAEEVIRNSLVPVMVLGSHAVDAGYTLSKKKLRLLVVSDLDSSGSAERYAGKLAKRLNAELVLFHSVGDPIRHMKDMVYSQRVVSAGVEKIFDEMKEFAETSMARKLKAYKEQGLQVSGQLSYDEIDASKTLKKNDWFKADIIIMGSHSRGRFLKAFVGSTVRKVLLSADRPVIVVRT